MKIVIEPKEIHKAIREYVIKHKLFGPIKYKSLYTVFRTDDDYQSFNGEIEVSLTDPDEPETEVSK